MISVKFLSKEKVARDTYSFYFTPEKPVSFVAGQFIELFLTDHAHNHAQKRWFTLSSSPSENRLAITTRINPSTTSDYKRALFHLSPQVKLKMANPMGDFVLPVDSAIPLIFIAGGIGCTPFRSIIKELGDKREKRNIRLLHAVRHKEEAAFQDVFGVLGDNYIVLETAKSGPLSTKDILSFSSHNPSCYYYVSGPEPMVEALYSELQKQGVQKNRILGDYFPGYNAP